MPLSEHEQQLLDQIEQALYAEDPKFASTVRGARVRRPTHRRRLQGIALLLLGLAALIFGLILPMRPGGVPIISVIGFPLMVAGAMMFLSALHAAPAAAESEVDDAETGRAGGEDTKPARSSLTRRMEDRLRKRFDGHG
ncbi:MAG: DUF3040 domain-containing protein [Sciscionella sp.]